MTGGLRGKVRKRVGGGEITGCRCVTGCSGMANRSKTEELSAEKIVKNRAFWYVHSMALLS